MPPSTSEVISVLADTYQPSTRKENGWKPEWLKKEQEVYPTDSEGNPTQNIRGEAKNGSHITNHEEGNPANNKRDESSVEMGEKREERENTSGVLFRNSQNKFKFSRNN